MSSPRDPDDLTARARIRDAAMEHFGEHGFDKATIRGIAETAGVSSGLLRHHFGSKEALRDACDEYVLRTVRKLNDDVFEAVKAGDLEKAAVARRSPIGQYHRYIARSLIDGGSGELFDEMVRMSEAWFVMFGAGESDVPVRDKAAVITAWSLGIPILLDHLSRALGVDLSTPEGDKRLARVALDLYSHPLVSPEDAAAMRAGLEGTQDD